jgi:AcrR family transcriptional regulator
MVHLVKVRSDAERNRTKILDSARELIGRDGPGVSMDAIAEHAGVAVGTLYRHHPTKAALVEAVVQDSIEQLIDAALEANDRVAAGADAGDELDALFRLVAARYAIDAAVKHAAVTLGAQVPPTDPDFEFESGSAEQRAWEAIQNLMSRAQSEGSIRADLTPADLLALIAGVPSTDTAPDVRDRYVDVVVAGMRATAP